MILITGGLGFIGSHVTRALLDLGESCVLVQRRTSGPNELITADEGTRVFIEQADVTDQGALREIGGRYKITGIVHLAGGFGVDPTDPVGGPPRGTGGPPGRVQPAAPRPGRRARAAGA